MKYGISSSTLQRWVEAAGREPKDVGRRGEAEPVDTAAEAQNVDTDQAAEIRKLREELRRERLHTELLNAMIDIAEEQFEIPIRKKRGARR